MIGKPKWIISNRGIIIKAGGTKRIVIYRIKTRDLSKFKGRVLIVVGTADLVYDSKDCKFKLKFDEIVEFYSLKEWKALRKAMGSLQTKELELKGWLEGEEVI